MTPRALNNWRNGQGHTQERLATLLHVDPATVARWETGRTAIPPFLPLALKGLQFTHGRHCPCQACYARYPHQTTGRDPRYTRGA